MNRLQYWIKADTQYNVHSPFMFDMYRKVLFARLPQAVAQQLALHHDRNFKYHQLVYKIKDYYGMHEAGYTDHEALLVSDMPGLQRVLVVNKPHGDKESEARWLACQSDGQWNVSVDLFDVGLLISHPQMHPQHFLLR